MSCVRSCAQHVSLRSGIISFKFNHQMEQKLKHLIILFMLIAIQGCASLSKKSLLVEPNMTKKEVIEILGVPEDRSFKGTNEAWQYSEVAGFGQCNYMIAWFAEAKLIAITNRRGPSVAGCGLGSREVDWGQMPTPTLNINIKNEK